MHWKCTAVKNVSNEKDIQSNRGMCYCYTNIKSLSLIHISLKPVVNIEMVDTGDCNMENPTGYNAGWINDHEIAKGAEILVTRSGGVIPKILSTLSPATQEEQEKLWEMCIIDRYQNR